MEIDMQRYGENLVVRLQGELDHHTAEEIRTKVDRKLSAGAARNIIFNLKGLTFIDSSGVGALLGRYRLVTGKGGRMALCNVSRTVEKVLFISGVPKIIPYYAGEKEALRGLENSGTRGGAKY